MASATPSLLGPPSTPEAPKGPASGLLGPPTIRAAKAGARPPMGLTENCSPTFVSSGDPCVDFFFKIVPDTQAKTVNALLDAAWAHDPLTALKLVCHLRAVRGTGKSDRKGFYAAALWLHRRHPKTLALNAEPLANFGYLKDLPEILFRLVAPGTRKRTPTEEKAKAQEASTKLTRGRRPKIARVVSSSREKPKKGKSCKTCRCKVCRCAKKGLKRKLARQEEVGGEFLGRSFLGGPFSGGIADGVGGEFLRRSFLEGPFSGGIADGVGGEFLGRSFLEGPFSGGIAHGVGGGFLGRSFLEGPYSGGIAHGVGGGFLGRSYLEGPFSGGIAHGVGGGFLGGSFLGGPFSGGIAHGVGGGFLGRSFLGGPFSGRGIAHGGPSKRCRREGTEERGIAHGGPSKRCRREGTEARIAAEAAKVKIRVEEAATLRNQKRATMAATAVQRYANDPDYRLLHDRTSDLFAALLSSDLQKLKSGDMKQFSLAAKWCPSLNSSYDRSTLLCESIARRLFPRESNPEYLAIEEQHYAYRIRDRLRKEVLVPLRQALKLPEVYMCARNWGSLPYSRVASVAMKNYKDLFMTRDKERFSEFLGKVKKGKAKIAAGALLPHEILAAILKGEEDEVAELQWRRMVSDILDLGQLSNCIAVCDVSGSMHGTPMKVCVALGMLISEMSEEPWKGRVITFSANPQLHYIKGETLREKAGFVKTMDFGLNTDFQKVFDQILRVAVEGKLEAEKMIKKVFVFSDMEFDAASGKLPNPDYPHLVPQGEGGKHSWETDYEVICRKFEESGYGSVVPEIVFWNLRDSRSTPVTSDQKGVALVSGFSKNLVKLFLKGEEIPSPKAVMEAAIAGEEYKKLVVYD